MNKTMNDLEKCFEVAKACMQSYVGVMISVPNCPEPEVTVNPYKNIDSKLAYYQRAYNEDLTFKMLPTIKIVAFVSGDTYKEIEQNLRLQCAIDKRLEVVG